MGSIGFFNANEVEPSSGNEPFPAGDYTMAVVASEVKDTKAGTGKFIKFEWQVVDGEHKGRKVFQNVNFQNPSPKAQQIGLGELSAICRACGKVQIRDTSELHNIPVRVRIDTETREYTKDDGSKQVYTSNVVKAVLWKETTKPDLAKVVEAAGAVVTEDDLPDFLK
jgi:hypothetical protein